MQDKPTTDIIILHNDGDYVKIDIRWSEDIKRIRVLFRQARKRDKWKDLGEAMSQLGRAMGEALEIERKLKQ